MSDSTLYSALATKMSLWYGFFVIAAGAMGYIQKGSVISLYSGAACGVAAIIGSRLSGSVKFRKIGLILLAITGGVLAAIFSRRIIATGEFMPGGFLFLNSGGMLLVAVQALKEVEKAEVEPERKIDNTKKTK